MYEQKTNLCGIFYPKGGAGKTTLTVLVASYLHFVKGYNVAVVDCDYPQHSIVEMRERDLKMAMDDPYYKRMAYEQVQRLEKKAYPVIESTPEDAVSKVKELADTDFDFIFFDLPGTINNAGVVQTIARMDYIFLPSLPTGWLWKVLSALSRC